jgi:hypothetical protein
MLRIHRRCWALPVTDSGVPADLRSLSLQSAGCRNGTIPIGAGSGLERGLTLILESTKAQGDDDDIDRF